MLIERGNGPQNEDFMNQDNDNDLEIPEQTSAPGGVPGKYYTLYKEGANLVLFAPDVAEVFRDSTSVNAALGQFLADHDAPQAKTAPK
jgi:hypothetical protein